MQLDMVGYEAVERQGGLWLVLPTIILPSRGDHEHAPHVGKRVYS